MTTVLLHTGQTAPILEPRQPEMRVVRGGKHGLNRARQFAAVALYVIAAALLLDGDYPVLSSYLGSIRRYLHEAEGQNGREAAVCAQS